MNWMYVFFVIGAGLVLVDLALCKDIPNDEFEEEDSDHEKTKYQEPPEDTECSAKDPDTGVCIAPPDLPVPMKERTEPMMCLRCSDTEECRAGTVKATACDAIHFTGCLVGLWDDGEKDSFWRDCTFGAKTTKKEEPTQCTKTGDGIMCVKMCYEEECNTYDIELQEPKELPRVHEPHESQEPQDTEDEEFEEDQDDHEKTKYQKPSEDSAIPPPVPMVERTEPMTCLRCSDSDECRAGTVKATACDNPQQSGCMAVRWEAGEQSSFWRDCSFGMETGKGEEPSKCTKTGDTGLMCVKFCYEDGCNTYDVEVREPSDQLEPQKPEEPQEPQQPQESKEPQKRRESQEPQKPLEPQEPEEPQESRVNTCLRCSDTDECKAGTVKATACDSPHFTGCMVGRWDDGAEGSFWRNCALGSKTSKKEEPTQCTKSGDQGTICVKMCYEDGCNTYDIEMKEPQEPQEHTHEPDELDEPQGPKEKEETKDPQGSPGMTCLQCSDTDECRAGTVQATACDNPDDDGCIVARWDGKGENSFWRDCTIGVKESEEAKSVKCTKTGEETTMCVKSCFEDGCNTYDVEVQEPGESHEPEGSNQLDDPQGSPRMTCLQCSDTDECRAGTVQATACDNPDDDGCIVARWDGGGENSFWRDCTIGVKESDEAKSVKCTKTGEESTMCEKSCFEDGCNSYNVEVQEPGEPEGPNQLDDPQASHTMKCLRCSGTDECKAGTVKATACDSPQFSGCVVGKWEDGGHDAFWRECSFGMKTGKKEEPVKCTKSGDTGAACVRMCYEDGCNTYDIEMQEPQEPQMPKEFDEQQESHEPEESEEPEETDEPEELEESEEPLHKEEQQDPQGSRVLKCLRCSDTDECRAGTVKPTACDDSAFMACIATKWDDDKKGSFWRDCTLGMKSSRDVEPVECTKTSHRGTVCIKLCYQDGCNTYDIEMQKPKEPQEPQIPDEPTGSQ